MAVENICFNKYITAMIAEDKGPLVRLISIRKKVRLHDASFYANTLCVCNFDDEWEWLTPPLSITTTIAGE